MKLNISPKELVALHNLLHPFCTGPRKARYDLEGDIEEHQSSADDAQLRQLYNRLRACLIAALSGKQLDPLESFLTKEQSKIDRLNDQLKDVAKDTDQLIKDFTLSESDDTGDIEYPRKGPKNRQGNKTQHKR